jgi:hypothetical protein
MATIEDTYEEVMQSAWLAAGHEGRKFMRASGRKAIAGAVPPCVGSASYMMLCTTLPNA